MELVKKEKALELFLWGLVAYAVAILIYFTLKALGHGAEFISALGSMISAIGTFFAGYVAIRLYSDWKDPYNKNIEKELAFEVISKYSEMDLKRLELLTSFENFFINKAKTSSDNDSNHLEFVLSEIGRFDIQLTVFSNKYNLYYSYSRMNKDTEFDKKITAVKRTIFEIDRENEKQNKINYIKHRLKHDLIELNGHFDKHVIVTIMGKLKADK